MTEEEVVENIGKAIKIQAPGMVCGFANVRIVDYDFNRNTPNGKGIVKYEQLDRDRPIVTCALSQIELYENPKKSKRRK